MSDLGSLGPLVLFGLRSIVYDFKTLFFQTREKNSNNVFIFVKHLNPKTSSENLENYLEGGAGTDAEVKENSTLFSRDNTEALVTFVGKPSMFTFNHHHYHHQPCPVPLSVAS